MNLHAEDRTLRHILNTYFFFIPRFQRSYSWEPEHVEELWEDAVQESGGAYFIGSMVVYPTTSKDTVAVIDGQQRLTTLMMLLVAIRDAAEKLGDAQLSEGTHSTFIERKDENNEARFVIKTETSYPYLQDEILSRGPAQLNVTPGSEEKAISAAHERLVRYVDGVVNSVLDDPSLKADKKNDLAAQALRKLREKVLDLRLIFVEVGDQDDATTIFVTLNSRGKDLEASDLVKAHLLQLLPKKSNLDRPREQWDAIVTRFDEVSGASPISMTDFLIAMWRSRYNNSTERQLHKDVRRTIKKVDAQRFLKELTEDAEYYRAICEPSTRKWAREEDRVAASLRFFSAFGIRQPMPMLLSALRCYQNKQLTLKQVQRLLVAIEDYHFQWTLLAHKTSSGGVSAFYAKHARSLVVAANKSERSQEVDGLVSTFRAKRPEREEFDGAFKALWFTDDKPEEKRIVQYVLERIHRHFSPKSATDYRKLTIEHLQPQKSGGNEVGRLGNLIYVSEQLNTKLDSKDVAAKQKILSGASHEWIPEDVRKKIPATDSEIQARTAALADASRTQVWAG